MNSWNSYSFVRFTFFLILGIAFADFFSFQENLLLYILIFLSLLYLLLFFLKVNIGFSHSHFGFLAFGIIFLSGVVYTQNYDESKKQNHISNTSLKIQYYTATIHSEIQERKKSYKATLLIKKIKTDSDWQNATGSIVLYIAKDSANNPPELSYGDEILISGSPQLLQTQKNPEEFDYSRYLQLQNIFHQHFIQLDDFQFIRHAPDNYLVKYAIAVRGFCDATFKELIQSEQEYGIATAFVLGIKDSLDDEVLQAYTNTGLMHVLAVSGFHIVFIVLILDFFFGYVKKIQYGVLIFSLIAIASLWFYAFITGLSPSVLRAVVMYTFILIAQIFQKKTNIYNTLAVSAFFLLCYDPYLIYSASFQLSYLAVIGIVYLYPMINYWFTFKTDFWNIKNKTWELTAISIAAQLATFPLGLLYFGQFPNYFLLSNLLILPIVPFILYAGLLTLAFSWVPFLNYILGFCLKQAIWLMNFLIFNIENLPYAVTNGISINIVEMTVIYGMIVLALMLFRYKKFQYLSFAFLMLLGLLVYQLYEITMQNNQKSLVIYNIKGQANFNLIEGRKSIFFAHKNLTEDTKTMNFSVNRYLYKSGIIHNEEKEWEDVSECNDYKMSDKYLLLIWQHKKILFIKKPFGKQDWLQFENTYFDYLVLQNNAMKDLKEIQKTLKTDLIIVDSSNKLYLAKKLKAQADELSVDLYDVATQGAWMIHL